MLLIAVSESDAEKSAGAYGEQTLVRLPAACLKIKLGMEPRVDTFFHIICKEHYAECSRAEYTADCCENFPVCARHKYHRSADEKENYRSGHMMFEQGYDADDAGYHSGN